MSSAQNHMKRSHRSQENRRSAMRKIGNSATYKSHYYDNPFISHSLAGSIATLIAMTRLRKSKESKSDKA